jgi:transposase
MEQRTTVGIDLAKEVFAVCVINAAGEVVERQRLRRAAFERWLGSLDSACVVAMEACSSAHH